VHTSARTADGNARQTSVAGRDADRKDGDGDDGGENRVFGHSADRPEEGDDDIEAGRRRTEATR
jgi:hypothetical protein